MYVGESASTLVSERHSEAQRVIALLEAAATIAYDLNPTLWNEVLLALNLKLCYQPAVAEVLRNGTWRTAANPKAYIATAAVRSARGKKLVDYSENEFRRVHSNDIGGTVAAAKDSAAGFNLEDWGGGGVYERTATGALRYVDDYDDDDDYYRTIPDWLQRGVERDCVDWETVAAYAALKPRMACLLARALIMRLELRIGRPEAMSRASSTKEASMIEAAWKWIDRNVAARITPLFQMASPPRALTATDIASFPVLAPGISLRVDIQPQWDEQRLILVRTGLLPEEDDGTILVHYVEADSEAAAMDLVRLAAIEERGGIDSYSDLFHYWTVKGDAERATESQEGKFAKPWEVLSRVGNRSNKH